MSDSADLASDYYAHRLLISAFGKWVFYTSELIAEANSESELSLKRGGIDAWVTSHEGRCARRRDGSIADRFCNLTRKMATLLRLKEWQQRDMRMPSHDDGAQPLRRARRLIGRWRHACACRASRRSALVGRFARLLSTTLRTWRDRTVCASALRTDTVERTLVSSRHFRRYRLKTALRKHTRTVHCPRNCARRLVDSWLGIETRARADSAGRRCYREQLRDCAQTEVSRACGRESGRPRSAAGAPISLTSPIDDRVSLCLASGRA